MTREDQMKSALAACVILILLAGCSSKDSTSPVSGGFVLTGQVRNQTGNPANGLHVSVSGNNNFKSSAVTGSDGWFSILGVPDGPAVVTLDSSGLVVCDLPRFIPRDTLVRIDSNTVISMSVREFTTLFYDGGNRDELWDFAGGVYCDSTRYVFTYVTGSINMMWMADPLDIPSDSRNVGFILNGEAGPDDSSHIAIWATVNGRYADSSWSAYFPETPTYFYRPFQGVTGLIGGNLVLELRYSPVVADYVNIREIWIYGY
jgi:hypothetical protein